MNSGHVVAWPSLTTSLAVGAENAWAVYRRNVGERNALSKTPHACCHKFVGRCRPSVHECWICLKFTPTSFVHFCSALFGPENHLSSNTSSFLFFSFIPFFFSGVDSLANFNNKITKISRIYAHPEKKKHTEFPKFSPISLSRNGEISPEKGNTISVVCFGLVFSLSVGLHEALAQLQLFYFGAGYV